MRRILFFLLFPLLLSASSITHIKLDGAVSPASALHLQNALKSAKAQNASMLLIELDTPGGLASAMRDMVQMITNSPVPITVFVAPRGAQAASAGTYLLYAAHIAAMAPGTNTGAATPVQMGSPMQGDKAKMPTTMEKKVKGDASAFLQSLAQMRDRNATWARKSVEESVSITAQKALELGVIDLIATDRVQLLQKLHGKTVAINGGSVTIETKGATIHTFQSDWKTRLLSIITDPNVTYILMLVAIYGIFFELMNPGAVIPGVVGVISGVLALYALNVLPFNYAGLLLIALGIIFMIAEVFVAGFGILGIGGTIAFAAGSILLFDAQTLGQDISLPLIIALSLVSAGFFIWVMRLVLASRERKAVTGKQEMIGSRGTVVKATKEGYLIHAHGETWHARSAHKLQKDQEVTITDIEGLTLSVIPTKE